MQILDLKSFSRDLDLLFGLHLWFRSLSLDRDLFEEDELEDDLEDERLRRSGMG